MAAVTLQDVADRAGVSLATASRVLNGSARIPGRAISERVRQVAEELGYLANAQAQALARASTRLIGLVVHDISDPYFSSIAHGVQLAARGQGREVLVADTGMDGQAEMEAVQTFLAYRTDAIVLAGSRWLAGPDAVARDEMSNLAGDRGRILAIGQPLPGGRAVIVENAGGAAELADALVALGHRRFAVLSGPAGLATARDRSTGFTSALARHGIEPAAVVPGGFGRDGGYEAAERLTGIVDAESVCVFAVNDVMAIGAIAAFRDAGLDVPGRVQVAGFDDIPTLRDFVPGLSTVRLPLVRIGARVVELALDGGVAAGDASVTGEVVLRESTQFAAPDAVGGL